MPITGEYQLLSYIGNLSNLRRSYEKVADAMQSVEQKGYGVVSPELSDITMEEPVLIRHGNKFGVKMKALSPSIHMILRLLFTADDRRDLCLNVGTDHMNGRR